jgi:hypothetical protein
MATQLHVLLDITGDPAVIVKPRHHSIKGGDDDVVWTPFEPNDFEFSNLQPVDNQAFTNIKKTDQQITAHYNDQVPRREDAYIITVTKGGTPYTSTPTTVHSGGGGNATIKNN